MNQELDKRWGIIYCPKQGVRHSQKRWERIRGYLEQYGVAYDFVQSENPESVERLTQMLIGNNYRTLIIVGGDSALNRALNGLLRMDERVRQEVALGVIPNGRGNDYASFWGYDEDHDEQTVKWLVAHRVRKVDVGYLEQQGTRRYFLNCVNVGLVANIMKLKYKTRRIFGFSALSYLSSMFLLLFQRLETKMHFHVNEEVIHRKVMTVCVGNAHGYGQTPSAVPYNGMLDVTVIAHPEVTQLIEGMWMLLAGRFLNHKKVKAYRTHRRIHFNDIGHACVSTDGIALDHIKTPLTIGLEKEWINFIIPG